jgi:hypothetical protein
MTKLIVAFRNFANAPKNLLNKTQKYELVTHPFLEKMYQVSGLLPLRESQVNTTTAVTTTAITANTTISVVKDISRLL